MTTTKTGTRYHFAYSREDLDLSERESPIPVPPAKHRPRPGGPAYIRPAQRQPATSATSTEMTLVWVIVCAMLTGSILGMLLLVVAVEISWFFWPGAGTVPWPF